MDKKSSPKDQDIIRVLEDLESLKYPYPPDLLAARRAAFMKQVEEHAQGEAREEFTPQDQKVIEHLAMIRSVVSEYPLKLWAFRRAAFKRQVAQLRRPGVWDILRAAVQKKLALTTLTSLFPSMNFARISLVVVSIAFMAFVALLLQENRSELAKPSAFQVSNAGVVPTSSITGTAEGTETCMPGYEPPDCLVRGFENRQDLIHPENGFARPAVAKDTIPGYSEIHDPAHVNDGKYGPGASWVSQSANSWIKIDLGKATALNIVSFGRDRLGKLNDGDPGQFVIAVALSDDAYANGNSANDNLEYVEVYDSEEMGFNGIVSGSETVEAIFQPQVARFIKITFENPGTAIDEVEVFMVQPPVAVNTATKNRDDELPWVTSTPMPTETAIPTYTPIPTNTPLPTDTPTRIPTDTPTPIPTDTPLPTDTPTRIPTNTPAPTDTLVPIPTDTPAPTDLPEDRFLPDGIPDGVEGKLQRIEP